MSKVEELLSELENIHNIVSNKERRSLTDVQRSIMMKSRVFSIKTLMNQIIMDTETEVEQKINNSIRMVRYLKKILSYEPSEHDLTYWYELHIFHRMMIASIIQANGQAGKLGLIGIAHTLSELLLGIQTRDPTSLLIDKDHPEYTQRIMVAYNMANTDTVIYGSLLLLLPFIGEQEAYHYIEKLMDNFVILDQISREHWNVEKYLEAKVSIADLNQRVQGAVVVSLAPSTIAIGMYNIFNKFGSKNPIPEHLFRKGVIERGDARHLVDDSLRYFEYSHKMMTEILGHIATSERYKNFDAQSAPIIQLYYFQYNNAKIITETFSEILTYLDTEDIAGFEKKATEILELLKTYQPYFANEQFLKSSMGEAMDSYLAYYIPIITYYIIHSGKLEILEQFKETLGVFLQNEGRNYFPKSSLNYLISYTTVLLKYDPSRFLEELVELKNSAETLEKFLIFFPRENMAADILGALFSYINGENPDLTKIERTASSIIEATNNKNIKILEYVEYITKRFSGEEADFKDDIESRRWLLDAYSYIYPDFSEVMKQKNLPEIIYYPVNLWQDAIISNSN